MKKNILGTVRMPEGKEELKSWLKEAKKCGINWIDTAWVYGHSVAETRLGEALEELKEEGVEFKVQSKIWTAHFKEVEEMFHKQLKSLRMEKIDAMLLHRPSFNFYDDIEAWKVLIKLQKEGLIDEIGVSNYDKDMIQILVKETGVKPSINQIEMSVSNFRDDRLFFNKKENIEIQAWSAFGNNVRENSENPIVVKLAKKYDVKPGTILSSFISSQGMYPIHASLNIEHLKETINTIELSKDEIFELKALNKYDNKYEETYPF